MMGLEFAGDVPFADVYVHSVIQAPDGRRMCKSLGTGIDPLDEIDAHGADAVRFGLLAMSSTQDVRYSEREDRAGPARSRTSSGTPRGFVLLDVAEDAAAEPRPPQTRRGPLDPLAPAGARRPTATGRSRRFDFAKAALGLYDFVYGELCDWYLELVKPRLYEVDEDASSRDAPARAAPRRSRSRTRDPVRHRGDLVARARAPRGCSPGAALPARRRRRCVDAEAEAEVGRAIEAVTALRGWRDEVGAARRRGVPARLEADGLRRRRPRTSRASRGSSSTPRTAASRSPTVAVPGGAVRDPRRRRPSTSRRRRAGCGRAPRELEGEIARAEGKLANEGFVARRRPTSSRPSATSSSALRARAGRRCDACGTDAGDAERYLLVARAVRHALRARPHAPADDRARARRSERFAPIHVVGTNGKSSTARMIAAILQRHGLRTGAYLSPHLVSFAERVRVDDARRRADGASPPRSQRAAQRGRAGRPHARAEDDRVTQFEALTAAAYCELARRGRRRRRRSRPGSAAATTRRT